MNQLERGQERVKPKRCEICHEASTTHLVFVPAILAHGGAWYCRTCLERAGGDSYHWRDVGRDLANRAVDVSVRHERPAGLFSAPLRRGPFSASDRARSDWSDLSRPHCHQVFGGAEL